MRIVVPTDFSDSARTAVQFAFHFTRQAGAELVLLHVEPDLGPTLGTVPTEEMKHELHQETQEKFRELVSAFNAEDLTLRYEVEKGGAVEEVMEDFVKKHHIDCIIMGSKGASGIKKVLMGSNTVDVINNSTVPVIVVPQEPGLTAIRQLLYASDLEHPESEVKTLVPFASRLKARIRVVHVQPRKSTKQVDKAALLDRLRAQTGYDDMDLEVIGGKDIVDTIERYAGASNDLLLAMFTHEASFADQLFSKGIVREIAWDSTVPLLVINDHAEEK